MPLVEIKDFNALIDNKPFFDQPVKTNKKSMKNFMKCQETMAIQQETCNIYYSYHKYYYKLIGIDLSRQTSTTFHQQINFTGKLEEDHGATMFFIVEKQQKTILNLFLDSLVVTE